MCTLSSLISSRDDNTRIWPRKDCLFHSELAPNSTDIKEALCIQLRILEMRLNDDDNQDVSKGGMRKIARLYLCTARVAQGMQECQRF